MSTVKSTVRKIKKAAKKDKPLISSSSQGNGKSFIFLDEFNVSSKKAHADMFKLLLEHKNKTPAKPKLSSYPIEELMTWRNAARTRAAARDKRLIELRKQLEASDLAREIRRLDKKQHSDLTWLDRLQRTLSNKVLG